MSLPVRFVVCTYNIWTTSRWPERREALQSFTEFHQPDILCLQELQSDSRQTLDKVLLKTHQRVEDPFEGWTSEGNIYWNNQLFEMIEYGAEQIGLLEQYRRLFWVRLRVLDDSKRTLFVSTAHYTWPGNSQEVSNGVNVRIAQAQKTLEVLSQLVPPNEPLLFMGDLNDTYRPILVLQKGGLTNSFNGVGRNPYPTWPALPTAVGPAQTIDWMFHRGPIRAMTSEVIDFFKGDLAPSDHKPVIATYGLI